MPSHSKKKHSNFQLTDSQQQYLQQLLPKRYFLAPLHPIVEQNNEEQDSHKHIAKENDHNVNMLYSNGQINEKKNYHRKNNSKIQKKQMVDPVTISNGNISVKIQHHEKPQHSAVSLKKKQSVRSRKNKKNQYHTLRQSESMKDISKIPQVQSQIKLHKQNTSKQRLRQKQSQSVKLSGSVETLNQLSQGQKEVSMKILNRLKSHKSSWPFRIPVDPISQGVPDYLDVIKQPMDLKTIQKKLQKNKYEHIAQFHADINKIFLNSYKFNPRQTNFFNLAVDLQQFYHKLLRSVQTNPEVLEKSKKNSGEESSDQYLWQNNGKKKKIQKKNGHQANSLSSNRNFHQPVLRKKYSIEERKQIVRRIHDLQPSNLEQMIKLVNPESEAFNDSGNFLMIDFSRLPEECIGKIERYIREQESMNHQNSHSIQYQKSSYDF